MLCSSFDQSVHLCSHSKHKIGASQSFNSADGAELELSTGELSSKELTGGGAVVVEGETHRGAALAQQSRVHWGQTGCRLVLTAALD